MRPPPTIIRRAVIDPVWPPIAVAMALVLLLVAAVSMLAAPLTRRRRLLRFALLGALYLVLDAGLVVRCTVLWLRQPLASRRDPARWSGRHEALLGRSLALLLAAARRLLGFRVEIQEPPDQQRISGHPLLVLARHGGPGDSFALVEMLMSRYRRRPAIVLTERLRWDPGMDLLLGRLPSCFVRRGQRDAITSRLTEMARDMGRDDAILLFPEGGNWTPGRHRRVIARLTGAGRRRAAADAASNPNVLPPHATGVLACLAGRGDLNVAVVAHTGLEDLVSPASIWRAVPVSEPMVVRWWYESLQELPRGAARRRDWLRLQWALVDSWIDARKAARPPRRWGPVSARAETAANPVPDALAGPKSDR
ncbi:MAG: 1-acyl-sn-glycerol-3-phosphate acyltransferase [Streptosporangiaceae bacterium]